MALIQVKYDPTLTQSEIVVRLINSSKDEAGENYTHNPTEEQQTSIYGIQCPIIAINGVMVAYDDILSFELDDSSHEPSVSMHIVDRNHILEFLNTPGNDNELRVEILPPFDNAYKKINLTFFISDFSMGIEDDIYIQGKYKLPKFTSSQFKSFGEMSLYELFENVSKDSELGFATNIENGDDKRFIYCPYNSYKSVIEKEISHSGDATTVYDWWIDCWNYLNLANMYERYKAIDSDEDMEIWISTQADDITEGSKQEPIKVKAELTNLIGTNESQLFVKNYRIMNNPGLNVLEGTDKIYSIYSMKDREYRDNYISDGDVKKDIFNNFEYRGEVYGDYDYITNGMQRAPFLQKMKNGLLEVDLTKPLLGIHRGSRVDFSCYYNDDNVTALEDNMEESNLMEKTVQTETSLMEIGDEDVMDVLKLDKTISGQYLVLGNIYKFSNREWTQTIILTRPIEQKPKILKDEND